MASILGSVNDMMKPDAIGKVSKTFGVSPDVINKGMAVAAPLVLSSLAKKTATPEGANAFADMMSKAEASGKSAGGSQSDMLAGLMGSLAGGKGGTEADLMNVVLGNGSNAISGTLSQKLGFNVQPMLVAAMPLVLGAINKKMKEGNLNASGVASMLQAESNAYLADPANKQTADMIKEAMDAGEKGAALRGKYTDAEWTKVHMAPLAAAYLVIAASPSRESDVKKEMQAAISSVDKTVKDVSPTSLLGTAFGGGLTGDELRKLQDSRPTNEKALGMISESRSIVSAKAPAEEGKFSDMILRVADNVAGAAKEGGFLGFGGQQVSNEERQAISSIHNALGR